MTDGHPLVYAFLKLLSWWVVLLVAGVLQTGCRLVVIVPWLP